MAIITCPECGQHPVSDRAAACPRCGCPIAAVDSPAPATLQVTRAYESMPTVREERQARLDSICGPGAVALGDSVEFPDGTVFIHNASYVSLIFIYIKEWCRQLHIFPETHHWYIAVIAEFRDLESVKFVLSSLNDESLFQLCQIPKLRYLSIMNNVGPTTVAGWLQLGVLTHLKFLQIPPYPCAPTSYDPAEAEMIRRELRSRLPGTIVC